MATQHSNTEQHKNERELLDEASLEGCYLDTLLSVIEDAFEEIDSFCDSLPARSELGGIRSKARLGLNVTYMAQDKAGAVKGLTDDLERRLYRTARRPQ